MSSFLCPSTCLDYVFLKYIYFLLVTQCKVQKPHRHTKYSYICYINTHFNCTVGLRTDLISVSFDKVIFGTGHELLLSVFYIYIDRQSVTVFTAICCSRVIKLSNCFIHFMSDRPIIWHAGLDIYWHVLLSDQLCCILYTSYIYLYIYKSKGKFYPRTVREGPEGK
jgi:hypothetical protein